MGDPAELFLRHLPGPCFRSHEGQASGDFPPMGWRPEIQAMSFNPPISAVVSVTHWHELFQDVALSY